MARLWVPSNVMLKHKAWNKEREEVGRQLSSSFQELTVFFLNRQADPWRATAPLKC